MKTANSGHHKLEKLILKILHTLDWHFYYLHAVAVLKHQFIQRDDVLARMLPFLHKR